MAEPAQKIMELISGETGTLQALMNRAGGFADNQYSVQGALNVPSGRAPHALTAQEALRVNTGAPAGTFQDMLQWCLDRGLTPGQIVTANTYALLLESGDNLLLESGDALLLEG